MARSTGGALGGDRDAPCPARSKSARARQALPAHLECVAIPAMLRAMGGKQRHISLEDAEGWLTRRCSRFPRDVLRGMFAEADYQRKGTLDAAALLAALDGALM
jgi:hypothetical protein